MSRRKKCRLEWGRGRVLIWWEREEGGAEFIRVRAKAENFAEKAKGSTAKLKFFYEFFFFSFFVVCLYLASLQKSAS